MKITALYFVLICSVVSFAQDTIIDNRTGVKIIFTTEGRIFPDSWYSSTINAKGISLDTSEYKRSEKIIKAVLLKYPVELIQNNLKNIYILSSIIFYDQSFGGTNSSTNIYLSNKGIKKGYTDFYLEQLFHAEFSSILFRNYKHEFDKLEWNDNNPDKFNYGKGGVAALKDNEDSEEFDLLLNKSGFINEYASSSLENDFNSFAKNLFAPKYGFDLLINRYDNLRNKRKLTIQFYRKLDKTFSEKYFNKILYPIE